jgi:polyhydroxybutyrate depolymerase
MRFDVLRAGIAGGALLFAAGASPLACAGQDTSGGGASSSGGSSSGGSTDGGGGGADGSLPPDPTPGCGKDVPQTGFLGGQSITVSGTARTFALTLPQAYDRVQSYPLVLVFHGDGGTGAGIRSSFKIEAASGDGAIFAYPDGLAKTWNIDQDPAGATEADIAAVDAIIADLEASYCVDKNKVFLTGFSKGAYFVNQLACRTKSAIRGIVTHSGGGPFGIADSEFDANGDLVCPSPAVPALQVQGDSDGTVDPTEGMKARDYWRVANACGTTTSATDPSPCVAYDGCARPEVWCLIPGMGHSIWSQGPQVTWSFFQSL